jgi:hypothetical protein
MAGVKTRACWQISIRTPLRFVLSKPGLWVTLAGLLYIDTHR